MTWNRNQMIAMRMARQGLLQLILLEQGNDESEQAYEALFQQMQPVAPVHFTRPGDPPTLVHRVLGNQAEYANQLRERHQIIKGRFYGGRIAYVLQEDLACYAYAFRKPLKALLPIHEAVLDHLLQSGGMSRDQLKAELPFAAGNLSKALQALQEAFLVYEYQPDGDWDTGWFHFATEWFELEDDPVKTKEAIETVMSRFIRSMVAVTAKQMKSWSGWTAKVIKERLHSLLASGAVIEGTFEQDEEIYYAWADDHAELCGSDLIVPSGVYMLDKSDPLVRITLDELTKQYKGLEVLQFLLIDGSIQGAVLGHWRIGPYDIDDIVTMLSLEQQSMREQEILEAVQSGFDSDHPITHIHGKPLQLH